VRNSRGEAVRSSFLYPPHFFVCIITNVVFVNYMRNTYALSPSPFSASLVITIITLHSSYIGVYSIHDSTEEAIKKMIEASERMIREQNNPAANRHLELEIKILQKTPRDVDKLERLLQAKEKQKEKGYAHLRHRKVSYRETEMLKVVLCLVCHRDILSRMQTPTTWIRAYRDGKQEKLTVNTIVEIECDVIQKISGKEKNILVKRL
jgi:hypothetical protein